MGWPFVTSTRDAATRTVILSERTMRESKDESSIRSHLESRNPRESGGFLFISGAFEAQRDTGGRYTRHGRDASRL